jgi:hypothetical protein
MQFSWWGCCLWPADLDHSSVSPSPSCTVSQALQIKLLNEGQHKVNELMEEKERLQKVTIHPNFDANGDSVSLYLFPAHAVKRQTHTGMITPGTQGRDGKGKGTGKTGQRIPRSNGRGCPAMTLLDGACSACSVYSN